MWLEFGLELLLCGSLFELIIGIVSGSFFYLVYVFFLVLDKELMENDIFVFALVDD